MESKSTSDTVAVNPPSPDPFDDGLDKLDFEEFWGRATVVPFEKKKATAPAPAPKRKAPEKPADPASKKRDVSLELQYARHMRSPTIRVGSVDPSGTGSDVRLWAFLNDEKGAHWRVMPTPEADAFQWLEMESPDRANPQRAASCVKATVLHLQKEGHVMPAANSRKPVIPILGAYLTIEPGTGVIRAKKPDPAEGMTYTVPARFDEGRVDEEGVYHPRAVDPRSHFGGYLDRFFPNPSARRLLQEAVGASLMAGCRERAWQLVGSGSNGKSTLLHILRALHPKTEAMDLSQLAEDKFALAKIIDATCVISTESTPNLGAQAEQKLKAIISRDPIQTRAGIGKDFITATPICTIFFAVNSPISWSDQTYGMSSKIGIVPFFEKVVRGSSEVVLDYHRQITEVPEEMAQVLDWALEGAAQVERQNGFSAAADMSDYADEVRKTTNPLYAWVCETDLCIRNDHETRKEAVYEHYVETLRAQGHHPVAASKFWPALDGILAERGQGERRERQPKAGGRKLPRTTNIYMSVAGMVQQHSCDGAKHCWTPEAEMAEEVRNSNAEGWDYEFGPRN
ncbi:DUF5906 domain-containing protein [Rhodanobacter sp. FW102-FHT14D06]|uniref:DUF5906 domain-containing protein n=2 Tax=unclassified Rhodanobacter TaxID=2621553 RepID=A0AB74UQZ5_9GAMM